MKYLDRVLSGKVFRVPLNWPLQSPFEFVNVNIIYV
jgi:hypothetical protein